MQITLQQKGRGLIHSTVLNGTELELGRISQSVSHRTFQLYMRDLQQFAERLNPTPVTLTEVRVPPRIEREHLDEIPLHVSTTKTELVDGVVPLPSEALCKRYSDYVQRSGQLRMLGSGTHGGSLMFRYYRKQPDGSLSTHQTKFESAADFKPKLPGILKLIIDSHSAQADTELKEYLTLYGNYLVTKLTVGEVVDNKLGAGGGVKRLVDREVSYDDLWYGGETLVKINAPIKTDRSVVCRLRFHRYGVTVGGTIIRNQDAAKRINLFIGDLENKLELTFTTVQRLKLSTAIAEKVSAWLASRK